MDSELTEPSITLATSTTVDRVSSYTRPDLAGVAKELLLVQGCIGEDHAKGDHLQNGLRTICLEGYGVARSRNRAILECDTDILIFSDDDTAVFREGVIAVHNELKKNTKLDFLLLRSVDHAGNFRKTYPRAGSRASLLNIGRYGTIEIAIRPDRVRREQIEFDTRFGAGTDMPLGDEFLFLASLLDNSLKGRHSSIVIARHEWESSGKSNSIEAKLSRQAAFKIVFPRLHHFFYRASRVRSFFRTRFR